MYLFLASCLAALVARLAVHPLDSVKTLLQSSGREQGLRRRIRARGLVSLYDGLGVTLMFALPGMTVYLYLYDVTTQWLLLSFGWRLGGFASAIVGACVAEMISGLLWTPMEVVKCRQQVYMPVSTSADGCDDEIEAGADRTDFLEEVTEQEDGLVPASPRSTVSSSRTGGSFAHPMSATSTWSHFCAIYRDEGLLGFQRGYLVTLLVFLPYSVIYFVSYEQVPCGRLTWVG